MIGFLFWSGHGAARVGGASRALLRYVKGQGDIEPPQDMHHGVPETQQRAWPRVLEETSVQVILISCPRVAAVRRGVAEAKQGLAKKLLGATRSFLFNVSFFFFFLFFSSTGCCICNV